MNNITVHFLPSGKTVDASVGDNLLQVALDAGVHISAACGGDGACGKCRVIVRHGEVASTRSPKISENDYAQGFRLACQTTLTQDVVIEIPAATQLAGEVPRRAKARIQASRHISQQFSDQVIARVTDPPAKKIFLSLPQPTIDDNVSDLSRIMRSLRLDEKIEIKLPVLQQLPRLLRKAQFCITLALVQDTGAVITTVQHGDTTATQYALAFDIGTTTVWGRLIDLRTKTIRAEVSAYNPQIPYGDDVISRIVFSQKEGGLEKLRNAICGGLNSLTEELLQKGCCSAEDILYIAAAGNTVMTHLLLGIDPKYIRETPYVPAVRNVPRLTGADIACTPLSQVPLRVLPCIASYVGGDIVAGVLSSGMYQSDKLTLYIDIGTNGEIVIGNAEWLMAAACSAGPAFEGGGLVCGMRATAGAIEGFSIDDMTGEPMIVTIGRSAARGICGSGAINILAEFLRTGIIDRSGKFNPDRDPKRIRRTGEGMEYVLVFAEDAGVPSDVVVREADIDNLIRAKAAMFAGYHSLLEKAGLGFQDIQQVIIAGAFGDYIDLEKAIAIGLLPDIPRDRYTFIGNGSLLGAQLVCLSQQMLHDACAVAERMTTIELSDDHSFMDKYVAGLFLPHTDISLFPTIQKWMGE